MIKMNTNCVKNNTRNKFSKLSLKKHKLNEETTASKLNRSSDVIILDESSDNLRQDFPKVQLTPKIYSPIIINDSSELSYLDGNDEKEPSKSGNVSFNGSMEKTQPDTHKSKPSVGGWSPAQNIICATPRHKSSPSIPNGIANESQEECSLKKIHNSQKKLLNDLYGDVWKSIPTLFKQASLDKENVNSVSKKLQFNDDTENYNFNLRHELQENKKLYLTGSDAKKKVRIETDTEKKSKKKLYTEKQFNTPEPTKTKHVKPKSASTAKKNLKGKSVTELVAIMKQDVDVLTEKIDNFNIERQVEVKRLSFMASLADNVPSWRCHPEALQYRDNFKELRDKLVRRLFEEFNQKVFDNQLDKDMPIIWDNKLRTTAGTTTNRLVKLSSGLRVRTSSIKLSGRVVDSGVRARDTLAHEMCHAATWLLDHELKAGHGPVWRAWATRAIQALPELGEISRCHNLEIEFKYVYKCTKCGYSIKRHSKSIDMTKKCCGYCRGTFELILNKKNKDGVLVSTPARKGGPNEFAMYVKENYGLLKNGKSHGEVMKILGEQFSARKRQKFEL